MRETFDGEAKGSKKSRLLLSAAVPASFEAVAAGYDVAEVNRHVDWLSVLCYDFHGDWEKNVNHNAPLFALQSASDYVKKLTVVSGGKTATRKSKVLGLIVGQTD